MSRTITLMLDDETTARLARRASVQGRTVEEVATQIVTENLRRDRPDASANAGGRSRSLYGVWGTLTPMPTDSEIDAARREMWSNLPREDIADPE